jgi:hypothetical protein
MKCLTAPNAKKGVLQHYAIGPEDPNKNQAQIRGKKLLERNSTGISAFTF